MFSKDAILEDYLQHNVWPPVPREYWNAVKIAIQLARDGFLDQEITNENGDRLMDSVTNKAATARDVVDSLNLWFFVEDKEDYV